MLMTNYGVNLQALFHSYDSWVINFDIINIDILYFSPQLSLPRDYLRPLFIQVESSGRDLAQHLPSYCFLGNAQKSLCGFVSCYKYVN